MATVAPIVEATAEKVEDKIRTRSPEKSARGKLGPAAGARPRGRAKRILASKRGGGTGDAGRSPARRAAVRAGKE